MKRPSPALVVSVVALVFSMTGGAFAVQSYVVTKITQIRPAVLAQIRSKVAVRPVAGPAGQSITGPAGIAGSSIPGPPGKDGAVGAASTVPGEAGAEGKEGKEGKLGPVGPPSAVRVEATVVGIPVSLEPGQRRDEGIEARCPEEGERPIGGGYEASEAHVNVYRSTPSPNMGWSVSAVNESTTNSAVVTAYVECGRWE